MALDQPELSPRESATRFTDTNSYYVSESSVYRVLKAHDLITSPAFIVKSRPPPSRRPCRRNAAQCPIAEFRPATDRRLCDRMAAVIVSSIHAYANRSGVAPHIADRMLAQSVRLSRGEFVVLL
jgi:hypothetical protein